MLLDSGPTVGVVAVELDALVGWVVLFSRLEIPADELILGLPS